MLPIHLTGEEVAVGSGEVKDFYYLAKKNNKQYAISSDIIDKGQIPFLILHTDKMAIKGKAYLYVSEHQDVAIRPQITMTYRAMIDSWMDYEHEEKLRYTLWKIIVECAYNSRVNIRVMTYPGWMKDSPLFTLGRLFGNCFAVNKPTLPKLKYLMNDSTKILGLNEIQRLDSVGIEHLSKFYEDVGDFKTVYINPTRGTAGAGEMCNIKGLSTLTFSNFPDSKKDYDDQKKDMFDYMFHPKIRSRIFPLLFIGGSEDVPACKERFPHMTDKLSDEDMASITNWMRAFLYFSKVKPQKKYKHTYSVRNTRWDRNFHAICERIQLYADSQDEYDRLVKLLLSCHLAYLDYSKDMSIRVEHTEQTEQTEVAEEEVVVDELTPREQILSYLKEKGQSCFSDIENHMKCDIDSIIDKMKKEGDVWQPKPDYYQVLE